jgi:hypothetical protein
LAWTSQPHRIPLEAIVFARKTLAASLFLAGLVINPTYFLGCAGDQSGQEREFDYGESQMLGLLDAFNETRSWSFENDGLRYRVELALEQTVAQDMAALAPGVSSRAWAQTAHACGGKRRLFGATASACIAVYATTVPVEGTLTLLREDGDELTTVRKVDVAGELAMSGLNFATGYITLSLSQGGSESLTLEGESGGASYSGSFRSADVSPEPVAVSGELKGL